MKRFISIIHLSLSLPIFFFITASVGKAATLSAPSSLSATATSQTQIQLKWTDNSKVESGFIVQRRLPNSTSFVQVAKLGINSSSYMDSGLAASTKYEYRVAAYSRHNGKSAFSNIASAVTLSSAPNPAPTPAPAPTPVPTAGGAPAILYTDALSGPTSGGENNQGAYLSIFGRNFGSNLGSIKVYIGSAEIANYRFLGSSKVSAKTGIQQLTVQVGALNGATQGVALPVKVVVNGVASNVDQTFTPNPGRIIFVSLNGNDATAVPGDITKPFRYLQTSTRGGAYGAMRAGDHLVIRGGNYSDIGFDNSWLRFRDSFARGTPPTGVTGSGWIHITAYPGEDVHYSTPASMRGGFQGAGSADFGTTGEYISISNLRMDVNANATSDAAPFNEQYGAGPWRIVNNEAGPWPSAINSKAAGYSGHGKGTQVLGNHIHHMHCTGAQENHGIYLDSGGSDEDLAYNYIHDITGGNLIQLFDNVGLAGNNYGGFPANWKGFTNISIHHNWLENSAKYGLNLADGTMKVSIYNNVLIKGNYAGIRFNEKSPTLDVTIAYNTLYNNAVTSSGSGNSMFLNTWGMSGAGRLVRVYDNVLSAGPDSVTSGGYYVNNGDGDFFDFRRNLYYDSGKNFSDLNQDASRIVGSPLFNSPTTGDFTLQNGSPAIDKATEPVPFPVNNDFTGNSRPRGAAADLGAFEK